MNPQAIKSLILAEIGSTNTNRFGWNFRDHLLDEPELHEYREADGSANSYWCVFREPDDGYLIIYDEEAQMFGLVSSKTAVAWFSSFMEALNGL
jgi:hypothetical protein